MSLIFCDNFAGIKFHLKRNNLRYIIGWIPWKQPTPKWPVGVPKGIDTALF